MLTRKLYSLFQTGLRPYFSQNGEDILINSFLRKEHGMYLDLGAYHPFRLSNTALLWARGWNGINVDANPASIKAFQLKRPNDLSLQAALITKKQKNQGVKEINFYKDKIDLDKNSLGISARGSILRTGRDQVEIKVPAKTVSEIINHCDLKNTKYLNVDIEGMDEEIIHEIDFDHFRPKVVTVEDHQQFIENVLVSGISLRMNEVGYKLVARCAMTSVFLKIDS